MLRLIMTSQTPEEVVLEVHGWVSREAVDILEQEGTRRLQEARRLVLDLKGARFIDQTGIALLQRWWGERLVLRGGSWFIQLLLEQHGLAQVRDASY